MDFYPAYMVSIGIYNCFWRYIGNVPSKSVFSRDEIIEISSDREKIAKLYPQIEKMIKEICNNIGKKENIEGDLLRYFTFSEMVVFLKERKIEKERIKELALRRNEYFYAYVERAGEYIVLDQNIIKKIKEDFFFIKNINVKKIKGVVAFRGNVKGKVFNLQNRDLADIKKLKKGDILVTSMTTPENISHIKKAAAIITDEGGMLCHAAIAAREFNIPCVIGTKIATKVLHDGQIVEVDAEKGVIRIV